MISFDTLNAVSPQPNATTHHSKFIPQTAGRSQKFAAQNRMLHLLHIFRNIQANGYVLKGNSTENLLWADPLLVPWDCVHFQSFHRYCRPAAVEGLIAFSIHINLNTSNLSTHHISYFKSCMAGADEDPVFSQKKVYSLKTVNLREQRIRFLIQQRDKDHLHP